MQSGRSHCLSPPTELNLGVPYGNTLAVLWPRFGPYHVARLEATGRRFAYEGWRVVGLEVARTDDTYAWKVEKNAESASFVRVTLFPLANYHSISPRTIAYAVDATLDRFSPRAVAIVGWSFPEARAALRWCRRRGAAAICMSDSMRSGESRTAAKEWVKRRLVALFDGALVAGKPHEDYVTSLGMPRSRIVQGVDAIDNDYYCTSAERVRENGNYWRNALSLPQRYFLSCSRFIPEKNLSRLLSAYSVYRNQLGEAAWDLVLAGSGAQEMELRHQQSEMAIEGVHWPGFLQVDTLPKYYGLASALILPSVSETWGLVVNEAMASGLPILASRAVGCHTDLVQDSVNGFIFDPCDVEEIADCMRRVSESPETQLWHMGEKSKEIVGSWGLDRFAESLWQITSDSCRDAKASFRRMNIVGWLATQPLFFSRSAK